MAALLGIIRQRTLGVLLVLALGGCTTVDLSPREPGGTIEQASTAPPAPAPAPAPPPAEEPAPAPPPPPPPPPNGGTPSEATIVQKDGAMLVRVYFATDRQWSSQRQTYTGEPNEVAPYLTYGSILVSIPEDRKVGEIPVPAWYNLLARDNEKKYVLLKGLRRLPADTFFARLRQAVAGNPGRRVAFIYIHGYNNSFDDAARRAGQMAVDLNLPIVPVAYSWPSRAEAEDYPTDEDSAMWTQSHLKTFLANFADRTNATDIYVIAHSMGNRPTTLALAALLEERPQLRSRFKDIILAAPDINAAVFRADIAPRFAKIGVPLTVYASTRDRALQISYKFHKWRRLGDAAHPAPDLAGIDFIDASSVTTNFMGHDYFASNRALLTDVATLFLTGARAGKRGGLKPMPTASRPAYYAFP